MCKRNFKSLTALMLVVLMIVSMVTGCSQQSATTQNTEQQSSTKLYNAGTYTGEGKGNNGTIKAEVTFTDAAIESIKVIEHSETAGLSDPAMERIPTKIVEGQTLKVDAVTGATNSSKGIIEAVASCVEQAGGDVESLKSAESQAIKEEAKTIEKETDLLIIGAGGAGLTAANAAMENGVENVILIEKLASFAGASSIAGGLAGGDSNLQRSFGLTDDTPEKIFMDIMKGGEYAGDPRITWLWANEMGPTLDWLIEDMGVVIENQFSNFPEHSVQRSFYVTGKSIKMLEVLADKFEAAGGILMMETEAKSLIMDGDAVVGAVAVDGDGNTVNIKAEKTILATGGFGNNPDMLGDALDGVLFYGAASSTGDGINMAKDAGAKLKFMDYVKMYPQGIEVQPGLGRVATVHSMLTTQQTGAIYVNKEGKRVVDENLDFVSIKNATKKQTDKIIYLVMDQKAWDKWSVLANGDKNSSAAGKFTFEEQEKWFNTPDGTPIFRRGNNIEEVAKSAGIEGVALKETIDNWNKMVAAGLDSEFGREELFTLDTDGTYYIVEEKLRFATTLGGLSINENFEVLNANDEAISGLYAAGENVGGIHGYESMPTCMLSWAVTSGKLAGESVAAALNK